MNAEQVSTIIVRNIRHEVWDSIWYNVRGNLWRNVERSVSHTIRSNVQTDTWVAFAHDVRAYLDVHFDDC
jgi:hypothetical protein